MTEARRTAAFPVALGFALAAINAQADKGLPAKELVLRQAAAVGDTPVLESEVDALAATKLRRLRVEEYSIRRQALEELIARRLFEREAKARAVTPEELVRNRIDDSVQPISEAEARSVYQRSKQAFARQTEAEALAEIAQNMRRSRLAEARRRLVAELKGKYGVRIFMEAPRTTVDEESSPSLGPSTAPVTIVEFSDFQCPACRQASLTVQRLRERYGERVRVVHRNFPLPMHKRAIPAAEAAQCANEQRRFWPMYEKMFTNQTALEPADLRRYAQEIGADSGKFDQCLGSQSSKAWQKDLEDGTSYGVSATPTFFINGRMLSGARPVHEFAEVIEEELSQPARRKQSSRD